MSKTPLGTGRTNIAINTPLHARLKAACDAPGAPTMQAAAEVAITAYLDGKIAQPPVRRYSDAELLEISDPAEAMAAMKHELALRQQDQTPAAVLTPRGHDRRTPAAGPISPQRATVAAGDPGAPKPTQAPDFDVAEQSNRNPDQRPRLVRRTPTHIRRNSQAAMIQSVSSHANLGTDSRVHDAKGNVKRGGGVEITGF